MVGFAKLKNELSLLGAIEIDVLAPITERMNKFKAFPVTADNFSSLKDRGELNGDQVVLDHSDLGNEICDKKKTTYWLPLSLQRLNGKRLVKYDKKVKDKMWVVVYGPKDNVVLKKKLKISSNMQPVSCKVTPGSYVACYWIKPKDGDLIGEIIQFYVNLRQ